MTDGDQERALTIPELLERTTITIEEESRVYDIGINQCRAAVIAGDLPGFKVGRRWIIPAPEVLRSLGVDPPTRAAPGWQAGGDVTGSDGDREGGSHG